MSQIKILSKEEIKNFDSPPKFNNHDREKYFGTNHQIDKVVDNFNSISNKVGFILLHGYFRACGKFITSDKFLDDDIQYVCNLIGVSKKELDLKKYTDNSFWRHKKIIAQEYNYSLFNDFKKSSLVNEIDFMISNQIRPREIILKVAELLQLKRTEIPSYFIISNIITNRLNSYEKNLLSKFKTLIDKEKIDLLDDLIKFSKLPNRDDESKSKSEIGKYMLTLLKKFNHSSKPNKIKESIDDFVVIKSLYNQTYQILEELNLPVKAIRYYAVWAAKSKISQLIQLNNPYKRYLHLISFITQQYRIRQDLFVDSFLASVQSAKNSIIKLEKEQYFNNKVDRTKAIKEISKSHKSLKTIIIEAISIIKSTFLSDQDKLKKVAEILELKKDPNGSDDNFTSIFEDEIFSKSDQENYYNLLEQGSIKLQNRVRAIIKEIEFNNNISDQKIIAAVNHYKTNDGNIDKNAPIDFLDVEEREALYGNNNKNKNKDKDKDNDRFRISLYKALLFIHIASAIKSGKISLKYSYRYLSIEEYLLDKTFWIQNKMELLKKAGLEEFADFDKIIKMLKKLLLRQCDLTNKNILCGKNNHIKFNKDGKAIPITPKVDKVSNNSASELFPDNQCYPILQILSDAHKATNFISCFEHYNVKYAKPKPNDEIFFGGIMGNGFDIGTNRIAKISKGINVNTLQNTINWYFTLDNLYAANSVIAKHINDLSLTNLFLMNQGKLHTASDGQKFNVAVDSLNSNYSFKYHGKDFGISVYSFNDEKGRLFYNTAFSSSEREAPSVIDGLIHNDEIRSDIHSTDTHGYSETIFAATHMLGIFFAPRIKNLKRQKLYSFKENSIRNYKDKGYKILPSEYIDEDLIRENWDDILRLIVTIKLKHSSASQIFKRLSSYAKQNQLYQALKEFGRIIKTIFILKYYDDLDLRQAIEKQLNAVELSHKFAKAIFFGNNQEFQVESKEEQEIVINCRRLIQNVIVLWNYLYLTKLLMEQKDQKQQQEILRIILNGSIVTWQHINFYGEYDFTNTGQNNSGFDMEKINRFEVGR